MWETDYNTKISVDFMINFQQFSPEIRIENSKILPCLLDFFESLVLLFLTFFFGSNSIISSSLLFERFPFFKFTKLE
jgi:hypothetical protein